jgi:hypothetical protein
MDSVGKTTYTTFKNYHHQQASFWDTRLISYDDRVYNLRSKDRGVARLLELISHLRQLGWHSSGCLLIVYSFKSRSFGTVILLSKLHSSSLPRGFSQSLRWWDKNISIILFLKIDFPTGLLFLQPYLIILIHRKISL